MSHRLASTIAAVTMAFGLLPGSSGALAETDVPEWLLGFARDWRTDWTRAGIDLNELRGGGPERDQIPAIDAPSFVPPGPAGSWPAPQEPVIALVVGDAARAYPLQILMYHEIVNDVVSGVPASITYCPLCNAAIAYDRRGPGGILDFGVSGLLRNSDLVMYDRQTESLWQQFTGECIAGELTGARLTPIPTSLISARQFAAAYPSGAFLSPDTGANKRYGKNPYPGYDTRGNVPYGTIAAPDPVLHPKERILAFAVDTDADGEVAVAYPLGLVAARGVINATVADRPVLVAHIPGVSSALDAEAVAEGRDIGATGVFDPVVDGQPLTFTTSGEGLFRDTQTLSLWNIVGQAVSGPLAGRQLEPIVHYDTFWFVWGVFRPDTLVYTGE